MEILTIYSKFNYMYYNKDDEPQNYRSINQFAKLIRETI